MFLLLCFTAKSFITSVIVAKNTLTSQRSGIEMLGSGMYTIPMRSRIKFHCIQVLLKIASAEGFVPLVPPASAADV